MFKDPTAIITGGAKGIGRAISESLAEKKWNLHLCGRDLDALKKTQFEIQQKFGAQVTVVEADLSTPSGILKVFAPFKDSKDLPQALICNAGDYGVLGNLLEVDIEQWQKSFELNFFSVARLIQEYLKRTEMSAASPRRKIIVMSGSGLGGSQVHPGISAYACAKAALYRLVEVVAEEVKTVDINCIAPGFVRTGITEQAVKAGRKTLGALFDSSQKVLQEGGTPPESAGHMVETLLKSEFDGLTGKLISAKWDLKYFAEQSHFEKILGSKDLLTLRRIDEDLFYKRK